MNLSDSASFFVFLLWHGGFQAVDDGLDLLKAYRDCSAGKVTFQASLTDANIEAARRLLKVLASAAQDPNERASMLAMTGAKA